MRIFSIFGSTDTWLSQGESIADDVKVCGGRGQNEETYCSKSYVEVSLQYCSKKCLCKVFGKSFVFLHTNIAFQLPFTTRFAFYFDAYSFLFVFLVTSTSFSLFLIFFFLAAK